MAMYIKDTLKASISGNAGTATKLATARNITVGNKTNSFDGGSAISFSLSDIGAAPSSHTHNILDSVDTRNDNEAPSSYNFFGIKPEFKYAGTVGISNSGGNYVGLLTYQQWSDATNWSGGKATQIAFADNGNMYLRKGNGSGWDSWRTMLSSSNYSGYALPLTGGTLSGRLHADGKISVKARGGSWIDTVNFDNVAIANNTEPSNGAYYPLLAARTEGMHTISLGSNYTGFGFYGFKNGRTENGVDLQFSLDVANHTMYTNAWSTFDNGMDVSGEINASLFRPRYAVGSQNCYIGGGNGDSASWDSHNMVIRSHWGIGFRDYQNICNIVFDTRNGNISSKGDIYSAKQFLSETGFYTNGTVTSAGTITAYSDLVCNGRAWINNATLSGMFIGEHKFSMDGAYGDPWEGIGCAIKAHGHIATNYTVKAGYLNASQGEFNGWPGGSDSFVKVRTDHDGNGQGDGVTHLGYNNGDGYHHFFRGTGAMHVNMHQGLQISNDFIYLAGVPLTISGNAPGRGGVWIQI